MGRIPRIVGLAVVLLCACSWAAAQEGDAAERWRQMTPEQRAELRERYEKLRGMSDEERAALVDRARELARIEASIVDELSDEEQATLDALPGAKRRQLLREMAADRARQRIEQLRVALPAERRALMENAGPEERKRLLDELRRGHVQRLPGRLADLADTLGLGPRERAEFGTLGEQAQKARLFELIRARSVRWVEENGLPEGLSERQWARCQELSDERFVRRLMGLRGRAAGGSFGGRGGGPGGRPPGLPGGERPERGGPPRGGHGRGGPPEGERPERGQPRERGGPGGRRGPNGPPTEGEPTDAERVILKRLLSAVRTSPAERLALAGLDPRERERRLDVARRERMLSVLGELGVGEGARGALERIPRREFHRAMRGVVRRLAAGEAVESSADVRPNEGPRDEGGREGGGPGSGQRGPGGPGPRGQRGGDPRGPGGPGW